jgi:hypothetical protein
MYVVVSKIKHVDGEADKTTFSIYLYLARFADIANSVSAIQTLRHSKRCLPSNLN